MEANWAGDDDDEPPDVILDGEGRVVLLACRIAPAHIRRGCEASPHLFEWQTAPKGVAEKPPDGKRGPTGNPAELV